VDAVEQIERAIRARPGSSPTVIVALDGRSAAGKSTLAERLQRSLGAAVVLFDLVVAGDESASGPMVAGQQKQPTPSTGRPSFGYDSVVELRGVKDRPA
jgi:hypothetical protein